MYQVSDVVVYGSQGICTVSGVESRKIGGITKQYYVLVPLNQGADRYYVPTQNQAALAKLRHILTKEQLESMVTSAKGADDTWIAEENLRKQRYRELIVEGDIKALLSMATALHKHKRILSAQGKKLHICDENFLRDVERLLCSEASAVLDIPYDAAKKYLFENEAI